jgi:hypothetical protein
VQFRFYGKLVLRPLAEGIDPSELLDERIALNSTIAAFVSGLASASDRRRSDRINRGANDGALQRQRLLITD